MTDRMRAFGARALAAVLGVRFVLAWWRRGEAPPCARPLACKVRRDYRGTAVAREVPDPAADADASKAGAEQVGAMLGAGEPFGDDRLRARVRTDAPGEVFARV